MPVLVFGAGSVSRRLDAGGALLLLGAGLGGAGAGAAGGGGGAAYRA